mmetsp:Transcript_37582/g.73975  ORF Transcript_37582/g.73975 Transcript_37582/m.73975 type:complete len:169 (+) Transcript_37582:2605-3111(+)
MGGNGSKSHSAQMASARHIADEIIREVEEVTSGTVHPNVRHHVDPHQPIYKLGGSTLHYLGKSNAPVNHSNQHGYVFKPAYSELMEMEDPTKSRSLLYMIPNKNCSVNQNKIFYIAMPKKKQTQQEEDDLFAQLMNKGAAEAFSGAAAQSDNAAAENEQVRQKKTEQI